MTNGNITYKLAEQQKARATELVTHTSVDDDEQQEINRFVVYGIAALIEQQNPVRNLVRTIGGGIAGGGLIVLVVHLCQLTSAILGLFTQ